MDSWVRLLVGFVGFWGLGFIVGDYVEVFGFKSFIRMGLGEVWVRRIFVGYGRFVLGRYFGFS